METDTILTILKWVGLVFAAGFIGYFGKFLSKVIISKIRKGKKSPETIQPTKEELDYKIEKKKLKLEKKRLKKNLKSKK